MFLAPANKAQKYIKDVEVCFWPFEVLSFLQILQNGTQAAHLLYLKHQIFQNKRY